MYTPPQEAVIVQPVMGQNNPPPPELHGSVIPELHDVSRPPPPVQQTNNSYTQKLRDEPWDTSLSREADVLESIKGHH